jgi:putative transcriptional regulator
MSKKPTTIKARKLKDGRIVEVLSSGRTRPFSDQTDWSRADAMTDEEIHAAALADPDAQPLTEGQLARLRPFSRAKRLRIRLRLTQEQFAKRYGIPLSTLRDWEQYRTEPDQAAQSYIKAIEAFPDLIAEALNSSALAEDAPAV